MFNKIKNMFEDEKAMASVANTCIEQFCLWWGQVCSTTAIATAIDTLFCGGQGMGRGIFVPICNEFMKLCMA